MADLSENSINDARATNFNFHFKRKGLVYLAVSTRRGYVVYIENCFSWSCGVGRQTNGNVQ
jgi:hypothetical protein